MTAEEKKQRNTEAKKYVGAGFHLKPYIVLKYSVPIENK